jgi:hypothetical protein
MGVVMLGLYFPYVYFPDPKWTLAASLYWDKMGRIIPQGLSARDNEYVVVLSDSGFILDVPLVPDSVFRASAQLENVLSMPSHMKALQDTYSVFEFDQSDIERHLDYYEDHGATLDSRTISSAHVDADRDTKRDDSDRPLWGPHHTRIFFLHESKFTAEAIHGLLDAGLAARARDLVGLPFDLARAYMADLGEDAAAQNALVPVSASPMDFIHLAGSAIQTLALGLLMKVEGGQHHREDVGSLFAQYAFRSVGLDFSKLRISENELPKFATEIVKLRARLEPFRAGFQRALAEVQENLPELLEERPRSIIDQHLEVQFRRLIQPELDRLERELKDSNISFRETVMNLQVTLPALVTGVAEAANFDFPTPLVAIGGSASAAAAVYRAGKKKQIAREKTLAECDFAMLHVIDRGLAPQDLHEKLVDVANRIRCRTPLSQGDRTLPNYSYIHDTLISD